MTDGETVGTPTNLEILNSLCAGVDGQLLLDCGGGSSFGWTRWFVFPSTLPAVDSTGPSGYIMSWDHALSHQQFCGNISARAWESMKESLVTSGAIKDSKCRTRRVYWVNPVYLCVMHLSVVGYLVCGAEGVISVNGIRIGRLALGTEYLT